MPEQEVDTVSPDTAKETVPGLEEHVEDGQVVLILVGLIASGKVRTPFPQSENF